MYQFSQDEKQKTSIYRLESNDNGFVVPTFNEALQSIVQEVFSGGLTMYDRKLTMQLITLLIMSSFLIRVINIF